LKKWNIQEEEEEFAALKDEEVEDEEVEYELCHIRNNLVLYRHSQQIERYG
jgi:hypothetical protein